MNCFRHLFVSIFISVIALSGINRGTIANFETTTNYATPINRYLSAYNYVNATFSLNIKTSKTTNSSSIAQNPTKKQQLDLLAVNIDYLLPGIVSLVIINIVLFYFVIRKKKHKKKLIQANKVYQEQIHHWKQKHQKQNTLLNSIPDILFVFNNENKITDVKTHLDNLLPVPKYKITGNSIKNVFTTQESAILIKNLQQTKSQQSNRSFTFTLSNINYETLMIPLPDDHVLCLLRDYSREYTILSRLENRLQNLEETHAGRDKFFSIIAHDLKNPFNALIGFSSLINEEFDDLSDEETKEYIKQIYQSSDSLFRLLKDLLTWTKSKTGELEYYPQKIDFNLILNENIKILWPEAKQKNIKLYSNSENNSIYVLADNNMLNSIIRNLTANAIKFTGSGGTISIRTRQKDTFLECAISDDGVGISGEDVKNIFKIDSKVRSQGTQNEEGTGLGLLLCKEFVEKHGGEIWVESKKDTGSTFYFTLPLAT